MIELKGVIPAITTPFSKDQKLDLDGFCKLIEMVIDDGVHGVVVNGCTGESWALSDDERALVFKSAVEQSAGRIPIVAGCGAICAKDAVAKVKQAENVGCDAVMIQPPWYVLIGMEEVFAYYQEILRATDIPIMLYNIPRRTGINLSIDLVDRLADEPQVIALKESSKDWLVLSSMIRKVRDRVGVFAGYANLLGLAALTEGAGGYVDSSTPVLGKKSLEFYHAAITGDLETSRRLQARMAKLNEGFFGIGTFPAGIKAALELLGRPGGWPRDPIKPLDDAQRNQIKEVLVSAGLFPPDSVQITVA
ncbi:MAG: dihydrodipicolinate synthase family protein [Deltaproteobacteria bacterium]|nr:dihydrodipicolinate synthase family protein [Deltaproteobacteria bacterium]